MASRKSRNKVKRIFISYSREAGQAHAVSLYQSLIQVLGEKNVFLDVGLEAMETGRSWKEPVCESLQHCDTLLLVLDPGMTSRLSDPQNAVFFELETALKNQLTIACVRVDGATVPTTSYLPPMLANLPEWHSPEIHSDAVVADIIRITKELTGRIPGQAAAIDNWDLAIFGILATLGIIAWFSLGKTILSLLETWLWAAALLIPWLIWMTARRVISTSKLGKSNQN